LADATQRRGLDPLAARLLRQRDDLAERPADRMPALPAGQLLRDGVQVLDVAVRVDREHCVADRLERDLRPLLLAEQRALRRLPLRHVGDRAFDVALLAVVARDEPRVLDDDDLRAVLTAQPVLPVARTA